MTDTVASQTAYVALIQKGATIASQTAYVAMIQPGAVVASQTAYVVLLKPQRNLGAPNYSQAMMGTF